MNSSNEHHHVRTAQEREWAAKSDDVAVRSAHLELARLHDLAEERIDDESKTLEIRNFQQ